MARTRTLRGKLGLLGLSTCAMALATGASASRPNSIPGTTADTIIGIFEGRTPCGDIANEFTGFPSQNCEKIKWRLTLLRSATTGQPTSYLYEGTRTSRRGVLRSERRSTAAWNGAVYHLAFPPGRTLSFLSVDDRVLVLLDGDLRAFPGDASWSYVLNRVTPER